MQPEDSLAGRLIYTARLCRTLRADHLLQFGVHVGQDALLKALERQNGQVMSALAAELGVRPPTISKMVARMESQGFVTRQGSSQDSRRSHVYLTDAGAELVARIDEAWMRAEAIALDRLSAKETKRLKKLLKKIRVNLEGAGKGDGPAPS